MGYYVLMKIKIKARPNAGHVRRSWGIKTTPKVKQSAKVYKRNKRLTVVE